MANKKLSVYRVRLDIGTALSVTLNLGKDTSGREVNQEKTFLPGAVLPDNIAPWTREAIENGDHPADFVEKISEKEAREAQESPDQGPPAQQQPEDVPGAPQTEYELTSQERIAASHEAAGGAPPAPNAGPAGLPGNPFADAAVAGNPED